MTIVDFNREGERYLQRHGTKYRGHDPQTPLTPIHSGDVAIDQFGLDDSFLNNWTKHGVVVDVGDVPENIMEDCVVLKAHDGYYYMFVSSDTGTTNFRNIYCLRGTNPDFDGLVNIGVILNNPLATWEDIRIRVRSIIYDEENTRYIIYYDGLGTVTNGVGALWISRANFPGPAGWAESANNPIDSACAARPFEGLSMLKRYGTYIGFVCPQGGGWPYSVAAMGALDNLSQRVNYVPVASPGQPGSGPLRSVLQVPGGYVLGLENQWGGNFRCYFAFIPDGFYNVVIMNQGAPNIVPTEAYEIGPHLANPYFFREIGSNILHLYYNAQDAGPTWDRVIRASTIINYGPPTGKTW